MPWDVLALLFGVNVMSLVLKESGLALELAGAFIPGQVYGPWLWLEVFKMTACMAFLASVAPHPVVATIVLPVVVALGFQLYAPVLVSQLVVLVSAAAVGTPYSSVDMLVVCETMDDEAPVRSPRGTERRIVERRDFIRGGAIVTVAGWLVVATVGYGMAFVVLGQPPEHIIRREPAALQPSVVEWSPETATAARLRDLEHRIANDPRLRGVGEDFGDDFEDLVADLESEGKSKSSGHDAPKKPKDDDVKRGKEKEVENIEWGDTVPLPEGKDGVAEADRIRYGGPASLAATHGLRGGQHPPRAPEAWSAQARRTQKKQRLLNAQHLALVDAQIT